MHWAWWLQQQMPHKWVLDGVLDPAPLKEDLAQLCHALTGGAGSGKTTTLRVIESLLDFFLGEESVMKSDPTNTAARMLGGDTVHATYKIPCCTMLGRRAKLSQPVLRTFRRRWARARAQAIDEISVLPPHVLFQFDMRARQAKQRENKAVGDLATCACGECMQLSPVDGPSLAMALDDAGYAQELGEEPQLRKAFDKEDRSKERRDFEHRSGFELWRERFTVVTCLTLNMRTEGMLAEI
jgi:hypothetical protein